MQTALTGRDNLESVTGESTAALLADFAIAVSADSLDGVARSRVPARYRFASRNFRAIYRKLFEAYGIAGGIGRPFPIVPIAIADGSARTGTMRPGTFLTYSITRARALRPSASDSRSPTGRPSHSRPARSSRSSESIERLGTEDRDSAARGVRKAGLLPRTTVHKRDIVASLSVFDNHWTRLVLNAFPSSRSGVLLHVCVNETVPPAPR